MMQRQHVLYDVWVEEPSLLARVAPWREILRGAAARAHATVITARFHQFEPVGVTGFLLLAESHISVHTWPEEGLAVIDIFSCGAMDVDAVIDWLRGRLRPTREALRVLERG